MMINQSKLCLNNECVLSREQDKYGIALLLLLRCTILLFVSSRRAVNTNVYKNAYTNVDTHSRDNCIETINRWGVRIRLNAPSLLAFIHIVVTYGGYQRGYAVATEIRSTGVRRFSTWLVLRTPRRLRISDLTGKQMESLKHIVSSFIDCAILCAVVHFLSLSAVVGFLFFSSSVRIKARITKIALWLPLYYKGRNTTRNNTTQPELCILHLNKFI